MSLNEKFHSVDVKKDSNVIKLINDLCAMTDCDQELAYMQLSCCDFDFETAANKILESSTNKHVDNEWQLINRQKKFKKKQDKVEVEPSGDGFKKMETNHYPKYKTQNQKVDYYKNEDKLNHNRAHRNRKNRFNARKPKEFTEVQNPNNSNTAADSFVISDSENELRWDNVADIDGAFKESSNHSQGNGFYNEDDFGFIEQSDDHSYRGLGTQLVSDIHQQYKAKTDISDETFSREQSLSSHPESQIINEYLANQLPIFGDYSQTPPPPLTQIIPTHPVSFYRVIKPKKITSRKLYNFGINLCDDLTLIHFTERKSKNSDNETGHIAGVSEQTKLYVNRNQIISPNDSNANQHFHPPGMVTKDYSNIINQMMQQQKVVAMLMGNHQAQNFLELSKSINMMQMPNSNHMEQMYTINRHSIGLHSNIENGIVIPNQDVFVPQSTFLTSSNMSVPFQATRK